MSGIEVGAPDRTRSVATLLPAITATPVFIAEDSRGAKGCWMNLCNVGAGAVNVTISWYDDSAISVVRLLYTTSVAVNGYLRFDLGGLWMDRDDELRVTASVPDHLEVVTTVVEAGV